MVTEAQVISSISSALNGERVSLEDTDKTLTRWDSLGHLLIQIAMSDLTAGQTDSIEGFSEASSVRQILAKLLEAGLLIEE